MMIFLLIVIVILLLLLPFHPPHCQHTILFKVSGPQLTFFFLPFEFFIFLLNI